MNPLLSDIKVVAFDIDGTIYPNHRLYPRLVPHVIRHLPFYVRFSRVRKILHRTAPLPDFYGYQSRLLADEAGCSVEEARGAIDRIVYRGLSPYLARVRPFAHVAESFAALRRAGLRLALLSDFPPSQKGDVWGLLPMCEMALGTEEIGALKPSKYPFGVMAMKLGVEPREILYVGNSVKYDVRGAANAGMRTALVESAFRSLLRRLFRRPSGADIVFSDYRRLVSAVLG